jgi:hypothetical protein
MRFPLIAVLNGGMYRYLDVPPEACREMMASESKASHYDTHVRHRLISIYVNPGNAR